ncbi:hypothetical protein [Nocardia sp. NPDC020380]|uniref:hypothetical protein n=1 Tax=Nocardia sp. NPDC020380 TaxID=3364309 RepID=UPI0037ADB867
MSIVAWQWPLILALILIRLLAPGWLILITLGTLGLPIAIVCGPLLLAASLSTPEQHPLIELADILLIIAVFTLPDGGDGSDRHVPLLTLIKFSPRIDEDNPIYKALKAIGLTSMLAYGGVLLLLWAGVSEAHNW